MAIGMGISAYQANQAGQLGAWFAGAAVSMAIGFAFPMPGIVNPFMRAGIGALRGAAIGAIAGGVSSVAAGGSFGAGAAQGAIGGAAAGAAVGFFTSQHYQNLGGGYGFKSNQGVLNDLTQQGRFQEAIDFAAKRIPGFARGTYDPDHPSFSKPGLVAFTNMETGEVTYGRLTFSEPTMLQGTGFHEGVHVQQFRTGQVAWGSDPASGSRIIQNRYSLEVDASRATLQNAGRLGLTQSVIADERAYMEQNMRLRDTREGG